jgi:hypothetical protein
LFYNSRQRCKKRQCHKLNPRVKKASRSPDGHRVEPVEPVTTEHEVENGSYEVTVNKEQVNVVQEVVNDIINGAWCELKKKTMISKKQNQLIKKQKCYKCDNCHKVFAQFASAKKHCTRNSKGAVCPICGIKVSHTKNLKRHILNTHHKPIQKVKKLPKEIPKCNECETRFSRMHKFKEHMLNKHQIQLSRGEDREMLNCPDCDFQNTSKSRMKAHFTVNHSDEPNEFQCSICDFVCKSKSGLSKHTKRVHKLSPSPEIVPTIQTQGPTFQTHGPAILTHGQGTQTLVPAIQSHVSEIQTHVPAPQSLGPVTLNSAQASQADGPVIISQRSGQSTGPVTSLISGVCIDGLGGVFSWEEYQRMLTQQNISNITTEDNLTYYNM